jgi:hypothetical protein
LIVGRREELIGIIMLFVLKQEDGHVAENLVKILTGWHTKLKNERRRIMKKLIYAEMKTISGGCNCICWGYQTLSSVRPVEPTAFYYGFVRAPFSLGTFPDAITCKAACEQIPVAANPGQDNRRESPTFAGCF